MVNKRQKKNRQKATPEKSDQQLEIPVDRNIAQVDGRTLIPPSEPDEPTDSDIDQNIVEQEAKLQKEMKELKAKLAEVSRRKRQIIGGKANHRRCKTEKNA